MKRGLRSGEALAIRNCLTNLGFGLHSGTDQSNGLRWPEPIILQGCPQLEQKYPGASFPLGR